MWFFIATLGVSVVGMISLISLKRLELNTGMVVGGRARPTVGAYAHRLMVWVEAVLPALAREWLHRVMRYGRTVFHRLAALSVVITEQGLERTLQVLRRSTQVHHSDTEASAFLREVSAHKKQLLKSTRKRGVIYDE